MRWFVVLCLFAPFCTPSALIEKKYATYNFTEEGFLSPRLIQTIGKSRYPVGSYTIDSSRMRCLENSLEMARERMLRIFVYTRFGLKARKTKDQRTFDDDYPHALSARTLRRAEADFSVLLDRATIALQDARSQESCIVVYRLAGDSLPEEIKAVQTTFVPDLAP